MPYAYVYLAGIDNSGPQHWQRLWQIQQGGAWVQHEHWNAPVASVWVQDLDAVVKAQTKPVVLIAHSLGCLVAAHWLSQGGQAAAAYMVAVPDVNGPRFPTSAGGFVAAPTLSVKIPTRVVASKDDPYSDPGHAFDAAHAWGAGFWELGRKGHINADSGLGAWPEGWHDMQIFLKGIPA